MMEVHEALSQISEIRLQMARSGVFRGFRSVTVGFSGVLALVAAAYQRQFAQLPESELGRYLTLWIGVAAVSVIVVGGEMFWRARSRSSALARQLTLLTLEQLSPSLVVGAVVTLCVYSSTERVSWMLPGLWSLTFSLGVFASHRLLPRPFFFVALYYAVCGAICLLWGQGAYGLSPWQMGISFGGGQLISAAILYWTLERRDASQQ